MQSKLQSHTIIVIILIMYYKNSLCFRSHPCRHRIMTSPQKMIINNPRNSSHGSYPGDC